VFREGRQVGSVRHYDNRLLQFLLRAHRPAIYGERREWKAPRRERVPTAGPRQLIDPDTVDAAMRRLPNGGARGGDREGEGPQPRMSLVMGVDVARFGDDRSVIVLRRGFDARVAPVESHRGLDLMTLAASAPVSSSGCASWAWRT
jgi:hypothetical protein